MRTRASVDANQAQIVAELRAVGVTAFSIAQIGKGKGDIIAGFRGQNYMFEIKDPAQPPSKRKLTPDEEIFHGEWKGQIDIVLTVEDAMEIMGILSVPRETPERTEP